MDAEWPNLNRLFRALDYGKRPIFACGHARSGTRWVLDTLAQAPGVLPYSEPAHWYWRGQDQAVMAEYHAVGASVPAVEAALDPAFAGLLTPPRTWRVRPRQLVRRTLPGFRVVVKEVAPLMYIEWVAERYDPEVLVLVRHPCAVVLSQLERGAYARGTLDVMLRDKRLMAEHLEPFRRAMEGAVTAMESAATVWAASYRVVATQLDRHAEWRVGFYEPLAHDPLRGFRALFDDLGLRWTRSVKRYIVHNTRTPDDSRYGTTRVSADRIDAWRAAMTPDEVALVRATIEPFDLPWYRPDGGTFDADYSWSEIEPVAR